MLSRYAIMTVNDGLTAQAGITDTPSKLNYISVRSSFYGVTAVPNSNQLVIKLPGVYLVFASVTFKHETDDATDVFTISLYRNGVQTEFMGASALDTGEADVSNVAFFAMIDFDKDDVLELYISSDTAGPATITVIDSQFGVIGA